MSPNTSGASGSGTPASAPLAGDPGHPWAGVGVAIGALVVLKGYDSLVPAAPDTIEWFVVFTVHAGLVATAISLRGRGPRAISLGMNLPATWRGAILPALLWIPVSVITGLVTLFLVRALPIDLSASGSEEWVESAKDPLLAILVLVVAPISEELFFRGFLFSGLSEQLSFWPAALLSSSLFAIAHPDLLLAGTYFAEGVVLCYAFWNTRSLVPPLAIHASTNVFAFYFLR